ETPQETPPAEAEHEHAEPPPAPADTSRLDRIEALVAKLLNWLGFGMAAQLVTLLGGAIAYVKLRAPRVKHDAETLTGHAGPIRKLRAAKRLKAELAEAKAEIARLRTKSSDL